MHGEYPNNHITTQRLFPPLPTSFSSISFYVSLIKPLDRITWGTDRSSLFTHALRLFSHSLSPLLLSREYFPNNSDYFSPSLSIYLLRYNIFSPPCILLYQRIICLINLSSNSKHHVEWNSNSSTTISTDPQPSESSSLSNMECSSDHFYYWWLVSLGCT